MQQLEISPGSLPRFLKALKTERPSKDEYFLAIAHIIALRSTCQRRAVGCVLTNKIGHILATGYNGVAIGQTHCRDTLPCPGAYAASGTALEACEAIHAEQNALLQCKNVWEIDTCYCTHSPCIHCVKLLSNTSCRRIIFLESYPHAESRELWVKTVGRVWGRWSPDGLEDR